MPILMRRGNEEENRGYPADYEGIILVGCAVLTAVYADRKPLFRILCRSV